jgi:hypothetical protein
LKASSEIKGKKSPQKTKTKVNKPRNSPQPRKSATAPSVAVKEKMQTGNKKTHNYYAPQS